MWANRDWVGRHLPTDTRPGHELAAYSRVCNAVEGNTTFYALPDPASVERWIDETPPDFRFVCKLPRTVTHDRRLRHADAEVTEFLERMTPLGERLGPVTLQLPPSFGPDDLPVLDAFLRDAPDHVDWAVEIRHRAFEAEGPSEHAVADLLARHDADRVVIDTRAVFAGPRVTPAEIEAFERKPRLAVRPMATSTMPIVRFIGQTDLAANEPFWRKWIGPVARWLADGRHPIVFLHTPDNVDAPALARTFHAAVAAEVDELAPLPEPLPIDAQSTLW